MKTNPKIIINSIIKTLYRNLCPQDNPHLRHYRISGQPGNTPQNPFSPVYPRAILPRTRPVKPRG
jgi:hypothetical protein